MSNRESRRVRARHRMSTTLFAAAVMALVATTTFAGVTVADAAEYDYPTAIDPASITVTTVDGGQSVTQNERVRVDATWSVPDGAVGGETFGFTLPSEFGRAGVTFAVPAVTDPSKTVAECTMSAGAAPVVTCTLTDYVNGRTGVSGSLWFTASADEQTTETTVEFIVDGKITRVKIPGGKIGPAGTSSPTKPEKWSWQDEAGNIVWQLALPGSSFQDAGSIVIDDALAPADGEVAEHHNEDRKLVVWSTDAADQDARSIRNWTGAWNTEGTAFHLEIPGPIDPERTYFVKYLTVPSSQAEGATYSNVANVSGIVLRGSRVWRVTGGGVGDGDAAGAFTLTKVLEGSGVSGVPADAAYTVRYSYGDPAVERTVAVTAGETSARIELPTGTVVTLGELTPPSVDGIEWSAPVFSGTGVTAQVGGGAQFTVAGGTTVAVTLTNTAAAKPPVPPTVTPPTVTPPAPPTEITPPTPPAVVTPPAEVPVKGEPVLATTGGDVPSGYLWAGGAAALFGIALTVLTAVRSRDRLTRD